MQCEHLNREPNLKCPDVQGYDWCPDCGQWVRGLGSTRTIRMVIDDIEAKGFETVQHKVDLNYKVSFPLAGLVMTLLGIPFAFSMGKRGTLVGVGLSLLFAMVYWGAMGVFRSLGNIHFLSPFLAAWGPNLFFGLIGLYLLFNLRT